MSSPAKLDRKPATKTSEETEEFDLSPILKWIAPVTFGILLVSAGFFWISSKGEQDRADVFAAFTEASERQEGESATDQALRLTEMAKAYLGKPEAAMALLQAGSIFYNEGDYEAALSAYSLLEDEYAVHELASNASWGVLHSQEELGNLDLALKGYQAIGPDELLHPQSLLATARVLEKQEKWSEALTVYGQVKETYPETSWAGQAEAFSQMARLQTAEPAASEE